MKLKNYIDLESGFVLYGFKDQVKASIYEMKNKPFSRKKYVFRGGIESLQQVAGGIVKKVEAESYKDYFFDSAGYGSPVRSIKSAISKLEDELALKDYFSFFIVLKKEDHLNVISTLK